MSTKRLKVLISVLACILIFMLGFNAGHGEDIVTELQVQPVVETGATTSGAINSGNVILTEEIYTWEDVKVELANKVNVLIGNYNISYAVVNECTTQAYDSYKHCIGAVLGVANAESSLFKKGIKPSNNPFGLMYKGKKRKFSSIEESIQVWVSLYKKNNWGRRTSGSAWVGTYCMSECKYWAKNYESAVRKLDLD